MQTAEIAVLDNLKRSPAPQPVYLRVVERIQELIKSGDLAPGDQLMSERELSEKLRVSRTSVRKAMAKLEGMGMIEVTPRDGAYVRRQSLENLVEPLAQVLFQEREKVFHQFEVRRIIESQAAHLAALRRDENDLRRLQEFNRQFEADLYQGGTGFEANTHFHIAVVEAAQNPVLTEIMVTLLRATIQVYATARQRSLSNAPNLLRFVDEHEQIIQAIAQQDAGLAAARMAKHIDDARQRIEGIEG